MSEIYLAGGCFWGLEEYFSRINGVTKTTVGYANGTTEATDYQQVHTTDHAETVHVTYDEAVISLTDILRYYFRVIDPLSINKQGNDVGRQYRTGIYYSVNTDLPVHMVRELIILITLKKTYNNNELKIIINE